MWTWSYGDGEVEHFREPEHEYAQAGEYDVVLTVFDGDTEVKRELSVSVSE
jgi:PKD repeat protein